MAGENGDVRQRMAGADSPRTIHGVAGGWRVVHMLRFSTLCALGKGDGQLTMEKGGKPRDERHGTRKDGVRLPLYKGKEGGEANSKPQREARVQATLHCDAGSRKRASLKLRAVCVHMTRAYLGVERDRLSSLSWRRGHC